MKKSTNKNLSFEENTIIEPVAEIEDSLQKVVRWRTFKTMMELLYFKWNVNFFQVDESPVSPLSETVDMCETATLRGEA